jgi:TrpR-related protein YerC/YecD
MAAKIGAKKSHDKTHAELFQAILSLKTVAECESFFTDLCTPDEIVSMAGRWQVAKLIEQEIPYREIHSRTGVSTATITRVARALQYGAGGYACALKRRQ